jgi:hypothetical protein
MEWTNENALFLIAEYEKSEILWNPRHQQYFNTIKKEDAWNEIACKLKFPVEELKKKMESLKGSFRRERSRIKSRMGTGKGK